MPSYSVSFPQLFFGGLKIEVSILTLHNIKQFTTTFYFVFVVQLTAYTQDSLPSSLNLSIKLVVYIIDFYPMTVGTTDFIYTH